MARLVFAGVFEKDPTIKFVREDHRGSGGIDLPGPTKQKICEDNARRLLRL